MLWRLLVRLSTPAEIASLRREWLGEVALALRHPEDLVAALDAAGREHPSPRLRAALREMARAIEEGATLADAGEALAPLVTAQHVALLRAAEGSTDPAGLVERSGETLHRLHFREEQVRGAMFPTAWVLILALAVLLLLASGPVESLAMLRGDSAPRIFRWAAPLSADGTALAGFVLLVVTAAACLIWLLRSRPGSRLLLALPLIGPMRRAGATALVSRVVAGLLDAGQPLDEAVHAAASVLPSSGEREDLARLARRIAAGAETVQAAREATTWLSPFFRLAVEDAGSRRASVLGLERIAQLFDAEVQRLGDRAVIVVEIGGLLLAGAVTAALTITTWSFYYQTYSAFAP